MLQVIIFITSIHYYGYNVAHVVSSCFSTLRRIRTIRRSLPPSALVTLVTSLVHSKLDYCNVVYSGLPACDLRRLQSVLNSAVRLITGARKFDDVTSLLQEYHWLPIAERIDYKLCMLIYRCLNSSAPAYLADSVRLTSSLNRRSTLRSASTSTLDIPRTLTAYGDRAFVVACPRAWNCLPANVRSAKTVSIFRKLLKTHLFRRAYCD